LKKKLKMSQKTILCDTVSGFLLDTVLVMEFIYFLCVAGWITLITYIEKIIN